MTAPEPGTGSKPTPDAVQNPQLARWQRFRNSRNTALASEHGWLTLTSFQWLEGEPAAVELAPGLWSTDGTAAFLTAVASDGLTLVETGEPVDGTISAVLADEESLMWVQYGGDDGRQVVVELAMRADKYAIRTRDSQSPAFTEFDGVPTFDFRPDLVIEARFVPYPEPVDVPIGTANPLVDGVHRSVGELVFRLPGADHEIHLQDFTARQGPERFAIEMHERLDHGVERQHELSGFSDRHGEHALHRSDGPEITQCWSTIIAVLNAKMRGSVMRVAQCPTLTD